MHPSENTVDGTSGKRALDKAQAVDNSCMTAACKHTKPLFCVNDKKLFVLHVVRALFTALVNKENLRPFFKWNRVGNIPQNPHARRNLLSVLCQDLHSLQQLSFPRNPENPVRLFVLIDSLLV